MLTQLYETSMIESCKQIKIKCRQQEVKFSTLSHKIPVHKISIKMALEERILHLEINHPTFMRKRKIQLIHMLMREFISGLEYSIILPSAWPYLKSMDVQTWFYGLILAMAPVGTIITLPIVGWFYDKTKKTRQLYTILNIMGFLGFLIYSLPFSPWLPFCGRILIGLHSADNPMFQGEISWTYRSEDRLRAFAIVLIGFFVGIVLGPLFSFTFEHINIHSGDFYLDYRNLPSISLALAFLILEILNRFMIVNLAKDCVDASGNLSVKENLNDAEKNSIRENKSKDSSEDQEAKKLKISETRDANIASKLEQDLQINQQQHFNKGEDFIENTVSQKVFTETETEEVYVDFDSEKQRNVSEMEQGQIKCEVEQMKTNCEAGPSEVTYNANVEAFHIKRNMGYTNHALDNESKKKYEASLGENSHVDNGINGPIYVVEVVKIDCHDNKSEIEPNSSNHSVKDIVDKTQRSQTNANSEAKKRSKLMTLLKECFHFEIMGVIIIAFIMWLFIAEGEAILPIVIQDHFGWSVLETNYVYIVGATVVIFVYIILSVIGNRVSDTRYLCFMLPVGGIAPIFLMLYSKQREGELVGKVLFYTGILLGVITEPFANAVTKSLLSKVTPLELQGSMGSVLTIAGRSGNLGGPLYATLVLEYMTICNLTSTSLFVIALLWLLYSLKELNYRRKKYAKQIKA